jgi:FAD/FMN-containing dehydrogenase/Fe-S oxidoreductase
MAHQKPMSALPIGQLASRIKGELHTGSMMRRLYATDASEYQEFPAGVVFPKSPDDLAEIIRFARRNGLGLIPRAAGTSLAGQCVGGGLVVDVGRYLTSILAIDPLRRRVRVEPGVVRNELNHTLAPHGMFFGPETSTANRAMMGGMMGNNSCGSNSIVYGSVRDHLTSLRGLLSDGSEVVFGPLTAAEFAAKCDGPAGLETAIYQGVRALLGDPVNRALIRANYPRTSIPRRNTGYALDLLMDAVVFDPDSDKPFNFCRLIAGSEGTLLFATEIELSCSPLPPPHAALVCGHFTSINESLRANLLALPHGPSACELIDRHILECTRANLAQQRNRDFVVGDPGAVLVVEFRRHSHEATAAAVADLTDAWQAAGLGYAAPVLWDGAGDKVWELRRAGQGLMSNVVGDAKPREVVEDTAVDVQDLPAYIAEFDELMRTKHGIGCVYYAHAGSGELHTRPLFDLKTPAGLRMFREVATDIALLVKKYQGSLSGEHGDGRLRGEFIPLMVGDACYQLMRKVKALFDPQGIFNPGKIVDTPPMDTSLRHLPGHATPEYDTVLDFSAVAGVVRAAEQCNGSADCRKGPLAGGTMCPSYMATREEKHSTRARANLLRQLLTDPPDPSRPFASEELKEVMDLCLSCKACKSECPSSVDVAKLKAEFLQQYYDTYGVPLRVRIIGAFPQLLRLATLAPWAWNAVFGTPPLRRLANRLVGFHPERSIPLLGEITLRRWFRCRAPRQIAAPNGRVNLFCDEFTDTFDVAVGIAAVEVMEALGYEVVIPPQVESGRSALSKGLLRHARKLAGKNISLLKDVVSAATPLVGIEPSAILAFRDEYPDLLRGEAQQEAVTLAANCLMFDEWFTRELDAGRLPVGVFQRRERTVKLHGHCQQRSLASVAQTVRMLQQVPGQVVAVIPSGCCGMAGAFGYEREHFKVANAVAELVLLPTVRSSGAEVVIAAPGTSCRHQILDGTGRQALHPAQVLHEALVAAMAAV